MKVFSGHILRQSSNGVLRAKETIFKWHQDNKDDQKESVLTCIVLLNQKTTSMQICGYQKTVYTGAGTCILFLSGLIHRSFTADDGTYKLALFCKNDENSYSSRKQLLLNTFYGTLKKELILNRLNMAEIGNEFEKRIKIEQFTDQENKFLQKLLIEYDSVGSNAFTKISNTNMSMVKVSSRSMSGFSILEERFLKVFSSMRGNQNFRNNFDQPVSTRSAKLIENSVQVKCLILKTDNNQSPKPQAPHIDYQWECFKNDINLRKELIKPAIALWPLDNTGMIVNVWSDDSSSCSKIDLKDNDKYMVMTPYKLIL